MNQEAIEARLAALNKDKVQLLATLNAIEGAIQDCQFWLLTLEKLKVEGQKLSEEPP